MKYFLALTVLFTSTVFAMNTDEIFDNSDQEIKQIELDKRVDNLEQQRNFDDYSRQMQEIDRALLNK